MLSEKFVLRMLHLHHLHLKAITSNSSNTFGDGRVPNRWELLQVHIPCLLLQHHQVEALQFGLLDDMWMTGPDARRTLLRLEVPKLRLTSCR